jgi:RNA polymerase sigma-70 factor (ECF subfamily)
LVFDAPALEEWMERYVDGDEKAFERLYEVLKPILLATLRRWIRDPSRVEDAFQVTLLKIHHARARYQRGAPVLPWCVTIARNVALDQLRAVGASRLVSDEQALGTAADPKSAPEWTEADGAEVIEAVRAAIDDLPPGTREIVRQHKLEGKDMAEIAAQLGIKPGTARVRAHRGYKELAKRLIGLRSASEKGR